jgi:hypothetical protein
MIVVVALNGCVVGAARVTAPPRLASETLRPLTRPISFDVCVDTNISPSSRFEGERREVGARIQNALARAGVPARLRSTAESPVDLTITSRGVDTDHLWSALLSLFTFSVVPGYYAERRTLDVDLAWFDAAQGARSEHLQYQSHMGVFVWLPLIAYHDVFAGINGGWESPKAKDAGFEAMVERLGDDVRARLGREGETPPPGKGVLVGCPKPRIPPATASKTAFVLDQHRRPASMMGP